MRRNPGHAASKRPGSNFPSIVNWLISEFKSFVWNLNFVAQQNLSSDTFGWFGCWRGLCSWGDCFHWLRWEFGFLRRYSTCRIYFAPKFWFKWIWRSAVQYQGPAMKLTWGINTETLASERKTLTIPQLGNGIAIKAGLLNLWAYERSAEWKYR